MTAATQGGDARPVIWLASYPKSGNTWVRAILDILRRGERLFTLSLLGSSGQPYLLGGALESLGVDPRWLTGPEAERVRLALVRSTPTGDWRMRKTHEVFRTLPHRWPADQPDPPAPFPADVTRAAIHLVRDPRDVVASYAHHFGLGRADAVDAMADEHDAPADPARLRGQQPWGSWTSHAQSWLREDIPFPVHRIRYEDLHADPVGTLLPVLTAVGIDVDGATLAAAVDRVRIDRLQADEVRQGFGEAAPEAPRFFRSGRAGGWQNDLQPDLVRAVEADHGETMRRLGYLPVHDEADLRATREARAASRRHAATRWDVLPTHLGIDVTAGAVPDELEGAVRPNRWTQVLPDRTLVSLAGGNRLLVSDGRHARVHVPAEIRGTGDSGWLLQGWAVAVAMTQRGHLTVHGSAIDVDGRTVCLAGRSGAGKSTTALGLRARGHRLLVDDVTVIDFAGSRQPLVIPYLRGVHLRPDAAARLGIDFDALPHLSSGRGKATFFAEDPGSDPVPLAHLVVLVPDRSVSDAQPEQVTGAERLQLLVEYTAREGVAPAILGQQRYFELLAALADAVPVVRIRRPVAGWSLDEVLDAIESITRG